MLCVFGGCREPRQLEGKGTNVILIVLDAASASFFSSYGAGSAATANIRRLARDSVVFEQAYGQSATTVPSVASLLTGLRPTTHLMTHEASLPEDIPTLAQRLGRHGYRAFGVVGNPMAGASYLGFDRGYEEFVHAYSLGSTSGNPKLNEAFDYRVVYPGDLNQQIFDLLPDLEERGSFAYFHYLQPHQPYDPPEEFYRSIGDGSPRPASALLALNEAMLEANRERRADAELIDSLETRYRANLVYVDAAVGALLRRLDAAGLYEESLVVLTADHGEAFFGHRYFGHNTTLYDDMTRVPLMIKFPASEAIGPRRLSIPTETVDLAPTLFDYLGLPIPERFEGDSLWRIIKGEQSSLPGAEVVLSTLHRTSHAIRVGDYKYIYTAGRDELYDLEQDPGEQWNIARREPDVASALRRKLESMVDLASGRSLPESNALFLDSGMKELLEKLGYVESEMDQVR
jgi:choline-sulfatase